ncbi:AAA family ATPase [Planktothrix sp. FACHB-1365]|uniref:WD40 domain-containing protein n=1 Tax=Planktothrix sp. FACHB-1365 TaxID=2692855 RepID=UPI001681FD8B|nr:AAA family ATPase [Planktothrix sp. FACHB-1365]MBD2481481.1 AAA family ATPase [Planktothrix sp. FACHB-1365]
MNKLLDSQAVASVNQQGLHRLLRSVSLSQGQFSLVLVRCNSSQLRQQVLQAVQADSEIAIELLILSAQTSTLYTTLSQYVQTHSPSALMILGLETVENLDALLSSTNQVRDEFRKQFNFPLILWITDDIATQLIRLAPDFKSWAAATIKFQLTTAELLDYLKLQANTFFTLAELKIKAWKPETQQAFQSSVSRSYPSDFAINSNRRRELELHWQDLQNRGYELDPALEAFRQFIFAQDGDANDHSEKARQHYQQSLAFLQHECLQKDVGCWFTVNRQGIVLFHIALTYWIQATRNPGIKHTLLLEAKNYFEQSQQIFEQAGRPDLSAGVLSHLGEVLQRLQLWEELQELAISGLKMHLIYGTASQLAQDYGFMAEVALRRSQWNQALALAQLALTILPELNRTASRGQCLLLLARCYQQQGEWLQARQELELALEQTKPQYNPQLYLDILGELRNIYYHQGQYRQAFRIKKKQRELEHQYGFRAFIGAAQLQPPKQAINPSSLQGENIVTIAEEMMASCRQQDIQNLLNRLSRDDHKLIIVHGRSGVGKSSLVNAGLVPALKNTAISARGCLPVVIQGYTDWARELERSLANALLNCDAFKYPDESIKKLWYNVIAQSSTKPKKLCKKNAETANSFILNSSSFVLKQLNKNADRNLLTVLIFDQFEEFFFVSHHQTRRKIFYDFLKVCLDLPFVKIIFSIREDYLHYLLECDYLLNLEAINNNILDKKIRYHLRDFTLAEAKTVIDRLTQRAKLKLEPALINALVTDLADERQEVRPIELQVVGAQLQEEGEHGITTLSTYQKLGINPKAELIKHSIEQVIQDCGQENEDAAWEVLFALTDEKFTRPIKTKAELITAARRRQQEADKGTRGLGDKGINRILAGGQHFDKLSAKLSTIVEDREEPEAFIDVILESGLLLRRREEPEDRYQLLHDYLVLPIRQRYALQEQQRQQDIQQRLNQVQAEKYQAEAALEKMSREQLLKRNQLLQQLLGVSMVVALLLGFTTKVATHQQRRADQQKQLADLATLTASSEALFFSQYKFDALMESLRAARQFQQLKATTALSPELTTMETRIAATLQQAVYGIGERNRLEGHLDVAWDVSFSPDGKTMASGSFDKTVKLWTPEGQLLQTLVGHTASVTSVSFSPDGQLLASASQDGTIKLWPLEAGITKVRGQMSVPRVTLPGHRKSVSSVTFSPDGRLIASGSEDRQLKLWSRDGKLLRTFVNRAALTSVTFSPDGQVLAIALANGMVTILELDGTILYNLDHTEDPKETVYKVQFSPNGKFIATVGQDQTLKLWSRRGQLLKTLKGDGSRVYGVHFSPDSKLLATSSDDKNIYLWTVEGTLLKQWQGHGDKVTNVRFSPDGKILASSSYDKTVKLWNIDRIPLKTLTGHQHRVLGVSFSPNGEIFASASQDKTVKLWSRTGALLTTLTGHQDRVATVSFSPDGELLATASYDHRVKLWKLSDDTENSQTSSRRLFQFGAFGGIPGLFHRGTTALPSQKKRVSVESIQLLNSWSAHDDSIMSVTFSPDGETIATASKDKTVKLWNRQGELLHTLIGHHLWVNSVTFSPDGRVIVTSSDDGTIKLWNHQGTLLKTIAGHQGLILSVSFSPDGQVIASAGYDNTVKLWDRKGNYLKTLLKGSSDSVTSVVFSPDSQLIASASFDGTVKLWSRQDGTLLKTLVGHRDSVMGISFSPDGQVLVSASRDKTLIMWNLDLDNLIDRACDWVYDYLRTNPKVGNSDRYLCHL